MFYIVLKCCTCQLLHCHLLGSPSLTCRCHRSQPRLLHCGPDFAEIKIWDEIFSRYTLLYMKAAKSRVWDHVLMKAHVGPLLIWSMLVPLCHHVLLRHTDNPCMLPYLDHHASDFWVYSIVEPQLELEKQKVGKASSISFSPSFIPVCVCTRALTPQRSPTILTLAI